MSALAVVGIGMAFFLILLVMELHRHRCELGLHARGSVYTATYEGVRTTFERCPRCGHHEVINEEAVDA